MISRVKTIVIVFSNCFTNAFGGHKYIYKNKNMTRRIPGIKVL